MTDKEPWANKAVHIVCKQGEKLRVTTMMCLLFKSKCFNFMCRLPSRMIPMLPFWYNSILFQAKYQDATLKQMKLMH